MGKCWESLLYISSAAMSECGASRLCSSLSLRAVVLPAFKSMVHTAQQQPLVFSSMHLLKHLCKLGKKKGQGPSCVGSKASIQNVSFV